MLIQRAQMVWYRQHIGLSGIRTIRANTKPCPDNIHPNKPISIFEINNLVPRGGDFEHLIRRHNNKTDQAITMATYNAVYRGLIA